MKIEKTLYRLPDVIEAAKSGQPIYLCRSKASVDALARLGLCGTADEGGSGKAICNQYADNLTGADVVIIQEADEDHAQLVAAFIYHDAKSLVVIKLPAGTVTAWIGAGGTPDELQALVAAAPIWTPPAAILNTTERPGADDSTELKAALFEIKMRRGQTAAECNQAMAREIIATLHRRGQFFFHADYCDHATAMFFDARRKLLLQIGHDSFQSWLADFIGINRTERTFAFIFAAIEDETLNGRTTGLTPDAYWARRDAAIYLSNGDGQAAKITAGKVELVDNGADDVLFATGRTLKPWALTKPADPFDRCRVFAGMKATAGHGRELLRLWATALPSNQRCKPPFVLAGTVGSGKTRTALGIAELFGLPARVLVPTENGEDDFWTSLDAGGLVVIDNADTRLRWLPDALAAASTDGSHEKRRLYSDGQIVQQRARAWIIVTSANPTFGADAGLADRLLVERLERRDTDNAESELSDEIAANRDAGMAWIAGTLSKALADKAPVPANLNKRHPDFATLAVRIGRAIGREAEAVAALGAAEADKSLFNLENDDVGAALMMLVERDESFTGTSKELLDKLGEVDAGLLNGYMTPKRLSKRLTKLWPHVSGIFSATSDHGHGGILNYFIRQHGGIGGFQGGDSPKVSTRESEYTLWEIPLPMPPKPPIDPVEAEERLAIETEGSLTT